MMDDVDDTQSAEGRNSSQSSSFEQRNTSCSYELESMRGRFAGRVNLKNAKSIGTVALHCDGNKSIHIEATARKAQVV